MNKLKKIRSAICMVLVLMLVLALGLSGCGTGSEVPKSQDSTKADTTQNNASASTNEDSKFKEAELIWYMAGSPQPEQDLVFAELNKDIKAKINATVKFNIVDWGGYNDKMQVLLSSGEPMDLCFTAGWINNYAQNVAKDAFLPLNDLLDKYAPKLKASVPASMWDATRINGKIYGLINQQISAMTKGVWVRKDLADKYKFDVNTVKKLEDIEPFLKAVKDGEQGITPLNCTGDGGDTTLNFLPTMKFFDYIISQDIPGQVDVDDNTLKVVNQFATPEFMNFCKLMNDWYKKGYFRRDIASYKDNTADMKAKKFAAGGVGNFKPGVDAEEAAKWGFERITIPLGKSVLQTGSIIATMHAIPKVSKNPERAMMLMELLNDPAEKAIYNKLVFGIENKHYKKTGDNTIELIKDSKYNPGLPWEVASTFNAYLLPGQLATVWEDTKKINASAAPSPLLGFSFDSKDVTAEIAACQSVMKEMLPAIDTGTVDPQTYIPKLLDKLDKAGGSKILNEMQKQVDAWKSSK